MRKRDDTISPARRAVHGLGIALSAIGGIAVLIGFAGFATTLVGGMNSPGFGRDGGNPGGWWLTAGLGMLLLIVGTFLRHVGMRGVAGSGLVLDPQRARRDLSPWARTGGGLLKDALDEAGLEQQPEDRVLVKLRCRECQALNDEDARYCDACGGKL